MTPKRAIDDLKEALHILCEDDPNEKYVDAFDMAIEALESQDHFREATKKIDGDTISRKALLAELTEMVEQHKDDQFGGQLFHCTGIKAMIECAPTVHPDVIHCRECVHHSHDAIFKHDWCNRTIGTFRVKPDDFCSYAERSDHE